MTEQPEQSAIGFRTEKDSVYWSVVTGTKENPTLIEKGRLKSPAIYENDEPARINWFHGQVLDTLSVYEPNFAMIRYPETIGRSGATNSSRERSRIEGVIIQVSYEKNIKVLTGPLAKIASEIDIAPKTIKAELKSHDFRGLNWSRLNACYRECILAAIAALKD